MLCASFCVVGLAGLGCEKDKKKTTPDARRRAGGDPDPGRASGDRPAAPRDGARESDSGPVLVTKPPPDRRRVDPNDPRGVTITPPTSPRRPGQPAAPTVMSIPQIKQLVAAGQYVRAIQEAKKILEQNEKSVPAMAVMAMSYFRKGDLELCRAVLASINILEKDNAQFLYLWGHLYLKDQRFALAQKYFERAVAKNPQLLDAWTMIGVRYLQGGSYPKALSALLKAKGLPGGNTYGMNLNIGSTYRGLAHRNNNTAYFITALNYFQEAEKLFRQVPGNANKPYLNATYNKAILFLDAKNYPGYTNVKRLEEGLKYLQQYVTLAPQFAAAKWLQEKQAVMKLLNKIKNADLPAARAMAKAAAAQPAPTPRPTPPPRRRQPPGPPPR
ncbi:MAG: tetratricopeptide repeat protein [bacterium]